MAVEREQLMEFLNGLGGRPHDNLKMLLYYGDLSDDFNDDKDWGALCEFAFEVDEQLGMSEEYSSRYADLMRKEEFEEAMFAMDYDLKDNKIFAAMAIHKMGVPKKIPLIAAAAYNKHSYVGLQDEFALTRFLHWSGFDVNAAMVEGGMTPLHLFSFTAPAPGSLPRAVEWLLERGADVDAVNANGDTAMAYLCGSQSWSEERSRSFGALLAAGSNPFAEANDGTTPYSVLEQANKIEFSEERATILAALAELSAPRRDVRPPVMAEANVGEFCVDDAIAAEPGKVMDASEPEAGSKPYGSLHEPSLGQVLGEAGSNAVDRKDAEPASNHPHGIDNAEDIPPELMAAAKAWRAKGGNLGALGRWSFRNSEANPTPASVARLRQADIEWARRRLGNPPGDKIVADARKTEEGNDAS